MLYDCHWSQTELGFLQHIITLSSARTIMSAYYIAEHVITDAAKFEDYKTKVRPMIAKYGGRYLTKGETHRLPEGGHWKPERVVIIEFPAWMPLTAGTRPRNTSPS